MELMTSLQELSTKNVDYISGPELFSKFCSNKFTIFCEI